MSAFAVRLPVDVLIEVAVCLPNWREFVRFLTAVNIPVSQAAYVKAILRVSADLESIGDSVFCSGNPLLNDSLLFRILKKTNNCLPALEQEHIPRAFLRSLQFNLPGYLDYLVSETEFIPFVRASIERSQKAIETASNAGNLNALRLLSAYSIKPQTTWEAIHTLLCTAAASKRENSFNIVNYWVNEIDLELIKPHLNCALELASINDNLNIVKLLRKLGGVVLPHAFIGAAEKGYDGMVAYFLTDNTMDYKVDNEAALIGASTYGKANVVTQILKKGSSHKAICESLLASVKSNQPTIIPLLFAQYPSLAFTTQAKKSLLEACSKGLTEIVSRLISNKVPIHCSNLAAEALFVAVKNNYVEIIEILLKNGANTHSKACFKSFQYVIASTTNENSGLEIAKVLLKFDSVDIYRHCEELLFDAIEYRRYDIIKLLFNYGSNIDARKNLPLLIAAEKGDLKLLDLLIEFDVKSCSVCIPSCNKNRKLSKNVLDALITSMFRGKWEFVQRLIESGIWKIGDLVITMDVVKYVFNQARFNTSHDFIRFLNHVSLMDRDVQKVYDDMMIEKQGSDSTTTDAASSIGFLKTFGGFMQLAM